LQFIQLCKQKDSPSLGKKSGTSRPVDDEFSDLLDGLLDDRQPGARHERTNSFDDSYEAGSFDDSNSSFGGLGNSPSSDAILGNLGRSKPAGSSARKSGRESPRFKDAGGGGGDSSHSHHRSPSSQQDGFGLPPTSGSKSRASYDSDDADDSGPAFVPSFYEPGKQGHSRQRRNINVGSSVGAGSVSAVSRGLDLADDELSRALASSTAGRLPVKAADPSAPRAVQPARSQESPRGRGSTLTSTQRLELSMDSDDSDIDTRDIPITTRGNANNSKPPSVPLVSEDEGGVPPRLPSVFGQSQSQGKAKARGRGRGSKRPSIVPPLRLLLLQVRSLRAIRPQGESYL